MKMKVLISAQMTSNLKPNLFTKRNLYRLLPSIILHRVSFKKYELYLIFLIYFTIEFEVNEDLREMLNNLKGPVGVIAVAG
jgi:hypothetical protein